MAEHVAGPPAALIRDARTPDGEPLPDEGLRCLPGGALTTQEGDADAAQEGARRDQTSGEGGRLARE